MSQFTIKSLKEVDLTKVSSLLNKTFKDNSLKTNYSAAYVIAKTNGKLTKDFDSFLESFTVKPQISPILMNTLGNKWTSLGRLTENCTVEEFAAYLLFEPFGQNPRGFSETPAGLSILSAKLMDIRPNDIIADLCTGQASFIRECRALGFNNEFIGSEKDSESRVVAMMRADILGGSISITSEDSLKLTGTYDKVFCHSTMGLRWRDYDPYCNHSASADWLFAEKCLELLSENGKAVCVFMNGSTWNQSDLKWRQKFIDSGYIETVIALPPNIYSETAISSCLVVLSRGNKSVNMINAASIYTPVRRKNTLYNDNIVQILELVGKDSSISRTVSCDEISANNYDIYPQNYTETIVVSEDSVPFANLISRITRGAQVKSGELDAHFSDTETATRLLMLSDMNKGVIADELVYLTDLDERFDKYCAADGALIITKNGFPVKTAIVSLEEGKRILVNGNLYIIEMDTSKVDPFYLKAYLDSEKGQAQLKSVLKGSAILNLPVEAIKGLQIPMRSMTEQKKTADAYVKKQQEVIKLQKQLDKAEKELTQFF